MPTGPRPAPGNGEFVERSTTLAELSTCSRVQGSTHLAIAGCAEPWNRDEPGMTKPYAPNTSSTHAGTSIPAGPSRVSSNHALPSDRSRFSSSVAAPYARAPRTNPAAG